MSTLPGARAVHHIAYTVPDLEQAVTFFIEVIGAELAYRLGPVEDSEGDWMTRKLGVHPRASAHIAMLRLGPVTNLELFEYTAPDQDRARPRNSDWGGHHFALYVDDVDKAAAYLRAVPGVTILGEPETIEDGPIAGDRWVYFTTPWGLHMELINMPAGMPFEETTSTRLYLPEGNWDDHRAAPQAAAPQAAGPVDESVNSNPFNRKVIEEFRANEGRVADFGDVPLLLLSTTGRHSGVTRTTPLVHLERAGRHIVFAANGGADTHPAWYRNLVAAGTGTVELPGRRFTVRPEPVPAAEHEELWRLQTEQDANFAQFRGRTGRDIPVVELVPVQGPAD
ncbi:nitroreductase/quinone reductase family protein [Streptomyces xylophagus]|uniref:nitroreductase/quinone reductase family protein n=1 Tax=Streptomyces xylophagus TaxID=285514 RepID=UPI000B0B9AAF|nr:nitroreductase/quinone reductase family protein [Streptomyces xylophagus]